MHLSSDMSFSEYISNSLIQHHYIQYIPCITRSGTISEDKTCKGIKLSPCRGKPLSLCFFFHSACLLQRQTRRDSTPLHIGARLTIIKFRLTPSKWACREQKASAGFCLKLSVLLCCSIVVVCGQASLFDWRHQHDVQAESCAVAET